MEEQVVGKRVPIRLAPGPWVRVVVVFAVPRPAESAMWISVRFTSTSPMVSEVSRPLTERESDLLRCRPLPMRCSPSAGSNDSSEVAFTGGFFLHTELLLLASAMISRCGNPYEMAVGYTPAAALVGLPRLPLIAL